MLPSLSARAASRTRAPGGAALVALYDGKCRFCTAQATRLARVVGAHRVALRSFQDPGVLDSFPGISYDAAMARLHVVTPEGRVFGGAEAVARALTKVPVVGLLAFAYYLPGVRALAEWAYAWVARHRYAWPFGARASREAREAREAGDATCDGTCDLHVHAPPESRRRP